MHIETNFFRLTKASVPLPVELHAHTLFTDGANSPEVMIKTAYDRGLKAIGFPEHVNSNSDYWCTFYKQVSVFRDILNGNIDIFIGMESKIVDFEGRLDIPAHLFSKPDYIVGVVHSPPEGPIKRGRNKKEYEKAIEVEFEALRGLIRYGNCTVIGHIGGTFEKLYPGFNFPRRLRRELLFLCKRNCRVVEFNSRYHYPAKEWIEDLYNAEVFISLGSDSHSYKNVGNAYRIILKGVKSWKN